MDYVASGRAYWGCEERGAGLCAMSYPRRVYTCNEIKQKGLISVRRRIHRVSFHDRSLGVGFRAHRSSSVPVSGPSV